MLQIPGHVRQQIAEHASAQYPEECCGILLGDPAQQHIALAIPAKNTAEERHHRYLIDPLDILRADKTARARRLDIIGFYHSHPDHPAIPSGTDLSLAWPDYIYVIQAVTASGAGDLRAWQLKAPGEPLQEIAVA
jgi:proteasome lid subunit RPN8/RPN11